MGAKRIAWILLGGALLIAPSVFAQDEFRTFLSKDDLFSANFPGDPVVTNITWETEYGAKIPGRVYAVTRPGPRHYSVTVVNYNPVRQIQTEAAKSCFSGDERCSGDTSFPGAGYWKNDVRGAMIFAAARYLKRDIKLTHYAWSFLGTQSVENNELQFVNNSDKSRTYVNIFMHHSILYVMEETMPANAPPPGLFVQSMGLKESDGTTARHYGVYFNGPTIDPDEAKTCSGGAGGAAAAPAGGAGNAGAPAPRLNACETLPGAVKFQQGPEFNYTTGFAFGAPGTPGAPPQAPAAPARAPAPAEPRRNQ